MINLLLYITAMAITPGPNTILSMANTAAVGLRKGVRLNIGMLIGITIVTAITFIAAEILYQAIPKAEKGMKLLAFIYLLFLAMKMLRKKNLDGKQKSASFTEGLLLQLVNVKVYLLALTAISAYIIPMASSLVDRALISTLIPTICFLSGLVWAIGGSLLKNLYEKHERFFSIAFALALLWCAIRILF